MVCTLPQVRILYHTYMHALLCINLDMHLRLGILHVRPMTHNFCKHVWMEQIVKMYIHVCMSVLHTEKIPLFRVQGRLSRSMWGSLRPRLAPINTSSLTHADINKITSHGIEGTDWETEWGKVPLSYCMERNIWWLYNYTLSLYSIELDSQFCSL